ncbi:MAG: biotin attachment protein [Proteobacteria bacterium]|jgi:pyruvate/2-oxoglutarate dehydrogenase complex dihydrolipoamide acyltransferase (E2) component|nr:MAG: biotin attachment protein [Pseudomonadota bacterium]
MTDVRIDESFWEGDDPAALTTWYYSDGAYVEAGNVIAEIMLQKTQMEIEAPVSGTLHHKTQIEQAVRKGDVIAVID